MGYRPLQLILLIATVLTCLGFASVGPDNRYDPKHVDSWVSVCDESIWGVTCDRYGGKDFALTLNELPPSCHVSANKLSCANMSLCDLKKWVRITERPEPCQQAKAIRCPGQNADGIFRSCRYSCNRSQSCLAACVQNTGCTISW